MSFIKEESEDFRIEEVFSLKQEDTEEQTGGSLDPQDIGKVKAMTNAERQKAFRETHKNDEHYKEKERRRKRAERSRKKTQQTDVEKERVRTLAKERQRKRRLRLKCQSLNVQVSPVLAYKSKQSLWRTVKRVISSLPQSPN